MGVQQVPRGLLACARECGQREERTSVSVRLRGAALIPVGVKKWEIRSPERSRGLAYVGYWSSFHLPCRRRAVQDFCRDCENTCFKKKKSLIETFCVLQRSNFNFNEMWTL